MLTKFFFSSYLMNFILYFLWNWKLQCELVLFFQGMLLTYFNQMLSNGGSRKFTSECIFLWIQLNFGSYLFAIGIWKYSDELFMSTQNKNIHAISDVTGTIPEIKMGLSLVDQGFLLIVVPNFWHIWWFFKVPQHHHPLWKTLKSQICQKFRKFGEEMRLRQV